MESGVESVAPEKTCWWLVPITNGLPLCYPELTFN